MVEWHHLGIGELQAAFAREQTKPSDYLAHMVARIENHNPKLQAFLEIDLDRARADAAESDQRFAEDEQRPLEGIVVGVKANIAVKGLELNAGAEARRGMIADADAEAVERLRNAGAIIIGTLNMHELALGATTNNPWFGACLNPHGEGLTPGGSSGGSGSAVAAGLCTAALGTDTLGSIRIPAAYCGVYGLKPTGLGALGDGVVPLSAQFDAVGPIARSLEDISMLTHILVAPDISTAMRRSRFLKLVDGGSVDVEPAVQIAFDKLMSDLQDVGGHLELASSCSAMRTAAFVMATRDLVVDLVELGQDRCAKLSSDIEFSVEFALGRSEAELASDEEIVVQAGEHLRREIASNGILITPTAPQAAFEQGSKVPSNQADFTALANIAGLPAITIPMGADEAGRPIGVQLIGPAGAEAMLIAQARMINDRVRGYFPPPQYW
jgi:aspartyl-tRNA(Asn)/glutamyl-tRNA(Gln) amidotransferase subunit A